MSPALEPSGQGWQLDKDGVTYRRRVQRGGKLYYQYSDTNELIAIQGQAKPLQRTSSSGQSSIPRYQPEPEILPTSRQSSAPKPSRQVIVRNENSGAVDLGKGQQQYRQESSHKEQGYEAKKRNETPLRPEPPPSVPGRHKTALEEQDPGQSKVFKQASLDELPSSIPLFLAISAGDFVKCRGFIASHLEVISVADADIFDLALQAQDSHDNASFLRCIERSVLIHECNRRVPKDRDRYLTRLAEEDSESLRAFYKSCNELTRQARQLRKIDPTPSEQERITQTDADQVDVKATERPGSMPMAMSSARSAQQQFAGSGRNAEIKDSFPLSRSIGKAQGQPSTGTYPSQSEDSPQYEQGFSATSRASTGQPAPGQRRQSTVTSPSGHVPPNASLYDPNRPFISDYQTGYHPPNPMSDYKTQSSSPALPGYPTNSSHAPFPGHQTTSSHIPMAAYQTQTPYAPYSTYQTPSSELSHVITSPTGQSGAFGQQNFGLRSHVDDKQANESRGQIKRPPPAPQQPSQKRSNGDPKIPRLNTLRDKEKIDYRGDVQRRELESHQEELDPKYDVQHSSFFGEGRVFLIPWPENFGVSRKTSNNRRPDDLKGSIKGHYGEDIFSHPVRMVVVQEKGGYSHCIRINSYGGQGSKSNLPVSERSAHAVIHASTQRAPEGESWLTKDPIAVAMDAGETLSQSSRIHFGKIYTVEHNVKVKPVGRIAPGSMPYFKTYFIRENFTTTSYK